MYDIQSTTETKGRDAVHTILWTFRDLMDSCKHNHAQELITSKNEETSGGTRGALFDLGFDLKLKLLNANVIEISYLSTNPVFLQSTLYYGSKERSLESPIAIIPYRTISANKWQNLATLNDEAKQNHPKNMVTMTMVYFKFVFVIPSGIKVGPGDICNRQLTNDFKHLLDSELFSDAVLKSIDGNEFRVHKAVLACRSVVLKAHFDHNTTECYTNVIESPFESDVLKEILIFIYQNEAPRVDHFPEKLLAAADYYQLNGLKSLCERALYNMLTIESAIEILQLADLHSAKVLKHLTLAFIKKDNNSYLVTKTDAWAKAKDVEIIKKIVEYIACKGDAGITHDVIFLRTL